jgi:nucleotide-binding universal stress UspA family protein
MSSSQWEPDSVVVGVVVGVDGSQQGYAAARYGAAEAHRLGVALDLVHVLPGAIPVESGQVPMVSDASLQSYGADILRRARRESLDTWPGVRVETRLRSGSRSHELLACAEHARVLVLGSRSPKNLDRLWTGGTLTAVAGRSPCPVVVVPAAWDPSVVHGRIAVGVKDPEGAHEAYEAALSTARDVRADVVVLHAWRLEGVYDDIIGDRTGTDRWQQRQTELIERELGEVHQRFPDVGVRVYVRHEDPAHALVRVTCGVDRLLLERPEAGGPFHHLGRVGRAVLRDARCPVVILPNHRGAHVLTPEESLGAAAG